ncbi:dephospho-CoA kinase [Porifericola rhodea]|uniref:dephospho-CoA kinase n=1 Tax=Porifericola rhodea TaxID=930972 RepID=UPI00266599CB|nr:dephospho-CoA kinase [Porifericola rhodea]WKN33424.1 dephospho-CoA kinase [Porifericola rhodea]
MFSNFFSVGITGGIGSGKSLVCKIFLVLGVPVYSSDDRAKWLISHDNVLKQQIIQEFGTDAYNEDGSVNRAYLANTIFKDENKRKVLNALVHPRVGEDFNKWRSDIGGSTYVLKEAALLFETGSYKELDKVINVSAPETLRLQRVLMRDLHRDKQQVESIIQKQWTDSQREELADFTIKNDEQQMLLPAVLKIHEQLLKLASM